MLTINKKMREKKNLERERDSQANMHCDERERKTLLSVGNRFKIGRVRILPPTMESKMGPVVLLPTPWRLEHSI